MLEKPIKNFDSKELKAKGVPFAIRYYLNNMDIVSPPKMKMADKIQYHVYYAMGAYMETTLENIVNTKENNFDNFEDALHILKIKLSNMNIPFDFTSELKEDILYRHCDSNLTARLLITTKTLEEVNKILHEGAKEICLTKSEK